MKWKNKKSGSLDAAFLHNHERFLTFSSNTDKGNITFSVLFVNLKKDPTAGAGS